MTQLAHSLAYELAKLLVADELHSKVQVGQVGVVFEVVGSARDELANLRIPSAYGHVSERGVGWSSQNG